MTYLVKNLLTVPSPEGIESLHIGDFLVIHPMHGVRLILAGHFQHDRFLYLEPHVEEIAQGLVPLFAGTAFAKTQRVDGEDVSLILFD